MNALKSALVITAALVWGAGQGETQTPGFQTTGSLSNTKIAFSSNRDGNYEVYTMNADGTGLTRLTIHPSNDSYGAPPSWSPDGTKIAFYTYRDGNGEVYTMNADGTGQTRLTNNSAFDGGPGWSPDGTKIAFRSDRDGDPEIYVMNADGTDQRRLTVSPKLDVFNSWSPDGTKIAFRSDRDGDPEIFTMNADGTGQTQLTHNGATDTYPSWSPDGTKIVFASARDGNAEIYVMNADGTDQRRLTTTSPAGEDWPSWSPDGRKIAFMSTRDGNAEIYVMNADGTDQRRITDNPAVDSYPAWSPFILISPPSLSVGVVNRGASSTATLTVTNSGNGPLVGSITSSNSQFTVSPTNFSVAAGSSQTVTVTFAPTRVGWEQGTLTITHNATVSPSTIVASGIGRIDPPSSGLLTNTKIAFNSNRDGNYEVYTVNPDGTGLTRLTTHWANDSYGNPHSWSPDGTKIAFVSDRDGNGEIYVMSADGTNPTRLTNNPAVDNRPSWSPDGTKIAFVSTRDGNAEIYVMNADGTNPTRLTDNLAEESTPSWSPDGTKIAFRSYRDGNYEIYVMNADGTGQTRLTYNGMTDTYPSWSPDGTQIAFASKRDGGGNSEIYVMNADGTNPTRLTYTDSAFDDWPSWSPDGTKIVFMSTRDDPNGEVYVMNADGTGQTRLTDNPAVDSYTSWSPFILISPPSLSVGVVNRGASSTATLTATNSGNGPLVGNVTSSNSQFTVSPTGFNVAEGSSQTVTVTFAPTRVGWERSALTITHNATVSPSTIVASGIGRIDPPSGSLSNTKIAFESNRDGNYEIYVMNTDGTGQTRLTNNPKDDVYPSWSPDGTKIVFDSRRDGNGEIYVMNADGTNQTRLTDNPAFDSGPVWSPDGTKIAFRSDRDGNGEIYVMNADGSNQTRLTDNPAQDVYNSWSPDGTKIAFMSKRDDSNGDIYVMNADGSNPARLTSFPVADSEPSWSPDGTKIAFTSRRDRNAEVYVMNADGSNQTRLTTVDPAGDGVCSWSPDGTKIVFASDRSGAFQIYTMNADGTGQTRLTDNMAVDLYPAWSPFPLPPVAGAGGPYSVDEGGSVTVTASGSDPQGDPLTFAWDLDHNGSFETPGQSVTFSAAGLDGPGSPAIAVKVTDSWGLSATAQATVNVLNVAPAVGAVAAPVDPVAVNTAVTASASFADPGAPDTHAAVWAWGDGSAAPGTVNETSGSGSVSGSHTYAAAGIYRVTLTVTDDDEGSDEAVFKFVVVYDPSAGFVTGGGWIDSPAGAYASNPSVAGRANFGFVAKYQKGANVPTGETQFNFKAASLNFHSTAYEWLVVAGAHAKLKGSGTINNSGDYRFMLTATDGQVNGGGGADQLRLKIWDKATGGVLYDNQMGGADDADATDAIEGGSIVIHGGGAAKPAALDSEDQAEGLPEVFSLEQCSPNPFNPATTIRYALPEASEVRLTIYNVLGQEVRTLVNETQGPGFYSVVWDGRDAFRRPAASGMYLYRLEAGLNVAVQKMVLAR